MSAIFINGKRGSIEQKYFSLFHGNSIFTTLRTYNKKLLMWARHWDRLKQGTTYFSFNLPNEYDVLHTIYTYLEDKSDEQKVRVIIGTQGYLITIEQLSNIDPKIYHGVDIVFSKNMVHPQFKYFKTGNSLPYHLAAKEAETQNVFEALLCDQDQFIVDGSRTGLLMIKDNTIVSLEGGLKSCMKEEILAYAEQNNIITKRIKLKKQHIEGQLLLASSTIGAAPVEACRTKLAQKIIDRFRLD